MSRFNFQFTSPLLLLTVLPVALALWLTGRRSRFRRQWQQRLSRVLRYCTAICLSCSLAGLSIGTQHAKTELTILVDCSISMNVQQEQMAQQLQKLTSMDALYDSARIIPFAGDSGQAFPLKDWTTETTYSATVCNAATSMEDALLAAQQAASRNTRQHIILLSDGLETTGDALTRARLITSRGGTVIDAIHLPTLPETAEAQLAELILPQAVSQNEICRATVRIVSSEPMRCRLELYDGETELLERNVTVKAGLNEFSYRISPVGSGLRMMSASIQPDRDVIAENNHQYASLEVLTADSLLLIEGHAGEGELLYALLTENGYDVTRLAPAKMPRTSAELGQYSVTLLLNVDANTLPAHADALLKDYVEAYGRSLLLIGGQSTLAYGNMAGTAFEKLLPVSLEVSSRASREPVALYLLIDNSASMGESLSRMLVDTSTPSQMSRLGAIKCLQMLNDNDFVGVITFSETATHLVPLTSAVKRIEITNELARMGVRDGTAFCPALYMAFDSLMSFEGAKHKHVIMITDGNPSDAGFEDIVSAMYRQGITVSTITVGHTSKPETARSIARLGGGTAHVAQNASELPELMVSDTLLYQADYTVEETFTPVSDMQLPPLYGYVRTGAKSGASVPWTGIDGDPIFALHDCGDGAVGVFTSDLSGAWSREWFADPGGRQAILSMIETLKPAAYVQSPLKAAIDYDGVNCLLRLTDPTTAVGAFEASVTTPDGTTFSLQPLRVRQGVYEAPFAYCGNGQYLLSIRHTDTDFVTQAAATVAWSPEYDAFPEQDGMALLEAIAEAAGGLLVKDAEELRVVGDPEPPVVIDPAACLMVFAVICFVCSTLLRRWRR